MKQIFSPSLIAVFLLTLTSRAQDNFAPQSKPPFLDPAASQKLFQLPKGYKLELVLSEPQVKEPAVAVFDGDGSMFVAEMRTYM